MEDIDNKIYFAFEKLFAAYRSHQWEINKKYGISPIMIQFLKYINRHDEGSNTITNIALEFSLTKPTVSDAIDTLTKKGFMKKKSSSDDSRVKFLLLTKKGIEVVQEIRKCEDWFFNILCRFSRDEKTHLYTFLIEILRLMRLKGDIEVFKSCAVCENFEPNKFGDSKTPHHCKFLNISFSNDMIKIDCPSNSQYNMSDSSVKLLFLENRSKR